jgi:hypothetical protein
MFKLTLAAFIVVISSATYANNVERIDCGYQTTKSLYIQADRNDNNYLENKLLVTLGDDVQPACRSTTFAYLDLSDPAFEGVMQLVTAAHLNHRKIRIVLVNEPLIERARRIEFVNL